MGTEGAVPGGGSDEERLAVTYVVPLRRWDEGDDIAELATYLADLPVDEVVVVDGSESAVFAFHARVFGDAARHLPIDPVWAGGRNGKVAGVMTGVARAGNELVVLADDDVRYDRPALTALVDLLAGADVVRPQNHFEPQPWHARWDTARTLVNRAAGSDHPGTLAVRRSSLLTVGGYDGDSLFENLELVRTIEAAGGTVVDAPWLFVARRPPSTRHFLHQRVRQAYDSFAQPGRLVAELALLPVTSWLVRRHGWKGPAAVALSAVAVAEVGRRRHEGSRHYGLTTSWWAPLWAGERAVCAWLAIGARLRGGARYAGTRLPRSATSPRTLRRRFPERPLHSARSDRSGVGEGRGG